MNGASLDGRFEGYEAALNRRRSACCLLYTVNRESQSYISDAGIKYLAYRVVKRRVCGMRGRLWIGVRGGRQNGEG